MKINLQLPAIVSLTRRNVKLFLRDKAAVFFSFLSTLIMVALYFLFIAKIYSTSLAEGAGFTDGKAADFLIYLQMMAGVLILNSMSLSMGVFGVIAKDFETKRVDGFLLTPVKARQLTVSYYVAAFIVSLVLNVLTWIASAVLIGALTGHWIGAGAFLAVFGILAAASLVSCSLMLFVTVLVKSSVAIGVIGGISGTFFGFLCGIYMPYSNLGKGAKIVGSYLPFTHLTIWLKQTVLNDAFGLLNIAGELKDAMMSDYFTAASVGFSGIDAPLWVMLIACGVFALGCLIAASIILKRRIER
ncbi:ABC transporter [Clostridia bacterium]|nr:ABC transporter [Clostridia bacterium]